MIAALVDEMAPNLVARNSIGHVGAAQLLLTAGDNPERLRSEASFASLCALVRPRGEERSQSNDCVFQNNIVSLTPADGMSFSASFANNNSDPDFNFLTNAPVTIGNGQANIKATDSNWTTMTVTPGMLSFDGFFQFSAGAVNAHTPGRRRMSRLFLHGRRHGGSSMILSYPSRALSRAPLLRRDNIKASVRRKPRVTPFAEERELTNGSELVPLAPVLRAHLPDERPGRYRPGGQGGVSHPNRPEGCPWAS